MQITLINQTKPLFRNETNALKNTIALKSDSSNRGFHILDMVNENNLLTYIPMYSTKKG